MIGVLLAAGVYFVSRDDGQTNVPITVQSTPPTQTQTSASATTPSANPVPATPPVPAAPNPIPPVASRPLPTVVLIPPVLQAEVQSARKVVELGWQSLNNGFRGEYVVERSDGGAFKPIATTRDQRYTDSSAEYGVAYRYRVTARVGQDEVSSIPVAASLPVPLFPVTSLTATAGPRFAKEVQLAWQGRGDPRAVKSFSIFRTQENGKEKRIASVPNGTVYVDKDADYGVAYTYRVAAVQLNDKLGDFSPLAKLKLEAPSFALSELQTSPLDENTRTAVVKWNGKGNPQAVDFFTVIRSEDGQAPRKIRLSRDRVETGNGFVYMDDTVKFAADYEYKVIPTLVDGREDKSSPSARFLLPAPKVVVSAPKAEPAWMSPGEVSLSWSVEGSRKLLRGYDILRSDDGAEARKIAEQQETRFVDRGLQYGHRYRYRIVAKVDGGGEAISPDVNYQMPPAAVGSLRATPGDKSVTLRWGVAENTDARFAVYRSDLELTPDETQRVAVVQGGEWVDAQPLPCKTNYYSIRALDGDDRAGQLSKIVGARIFGLLGPVQGVQCKVFGGQAFLDWSALESCDFSAYRIEAQRAGKWTQAGLTDRTWWSVDLPGGKDGDLRISVVNAGKQAGPAVEIKIREGSCL